MKHQHDLNLETALRDKKLKSTPLRLALLELLSKSQKPLKAEDMVTALKDQSFDRATLFRSLKTFVECGLLAAVDLGEGFLRYERNCKTHHHHHHIICTKCKKIEIVPFCIPEEFKKHLSRKGYKKITHRLDFSGICKSCA